MPHYYVIKFMEIDAIKLVEVNSVMTEIFTIL